MKETSGFYSHMPKTAEVELEPRKTPQQSRSVATVQAIYDATIQVLLKDGLEGLTTVHVAQRAGVSVGTLYQYFPNKQALLFAVLERKLLRVAEAVETACAANRFQPLEVMVTELVNSFVDAKLVDREGSVALYRVASEVGANAVVDGIRERSQGAIVALLRTAKLPATADVPFMAYIIFLTVAGVMRGQLESGAPANTTRKLREHLTRLVLAYCEAV
jgi:AcrR family transcriptional regulator